MAKKIAYAIARESSGDKTLANQFADISKVANDLGYEIVQEFGENVSGNIAKYDYANPKFIDDLDIAIKRKRPDAIFCVSMDRITRTPVMQGKYLMDFSVIPQIPIYFTRYKRWTIDPSTMIVDKDWIDELATEKGGKTERLNIVARTTPQREKNGEEGYFIGHLSDGYCVEEKWGTYEDGHRRKIKNIIIDEDRRKVIEDIYRYYRNGYSVGKIADLLNSDDIPTANRYRAATPEKFGYKQKYKSRDGLERKRDDLKWNGSLVSQILTNPWYKGERTYRGKELTHDAIIPKEEWNEVKALREENKKSFRNKREASKHVFLLSNLFFCGRCGRKMYGHFAGLNNHYYCCSKDFKIHCGLTGICKENVEAIIYDIISNKAINTAIEGVDNGIVTDFFKLDKKKELEIKQDIANSKKIISNLEAENEKLGKTIGHLIHLQGQSYNNHQMTERYGAEINSTNSLIEENNKKILKHQLEIKNSNQSLSSYSNIKEILKNILEQKDVRTIKQLFKQAIEKVLIFNAEKRDDVIRVLFKNGIETEFVYCARLLGNKYIPLDAPLRYDEEVQLIVSMQPTFIVIDNEDYVFIRNKPSNVEQEKRILPNLNIEQTRCLGINEGVKVNEFIKFVRDTDMAVPYVRLEEEQEIARKQRAHHQQWRKKYNTGNPSGYEPYILHNETYEEINLLRKRLYNKAYKIKNKKKITEEERGSKLAEIKRKLDALTVQVPLIKPRKKRNSKTDNTNDDLAILLEPTE